MASKGCGNKLGMKGFRITCSNCDNVQYAPEDGIKCLKCGEKLSFLRD